MEPGYRVVEAGDGMFAVELWKLGKLVYVKKGFATREQAEAWIVPVEGED